MLKQIKMLSTISLMAAATAFFAACGGGGGGYGGGGGALPHPGPTPTPTPPPGLSGSMQIATGGNTGSGFTYTPASSAQVVFSCGCTAQAGTAGADGSGNFTLVAVSTPTPSAPDPTYTIVPTRNYVIVAKSTGVGEAWNLEFAGSMPSHDLSLGGGTAGPSDVYTAAATLYVYQNSNSGSLAFDEWNFNTVMNWLTTLHTGPNGAETTLLNDIAVQSAAHNTLFPSKPSWDSSQPINPTIAADLAAVKTSTDSTKPTPCPGGACTGTPSP